MVFPNNLHRHRNLYCGASGIALDLVAATNDAGMEDRSHVRNPCSKLDIVQSYAGVHTYDQGVLHFFYKRIMKSFTSRASQ